MIFSDFSLFPGKNIIGSQPFYIQALIYLNTVSHDKLSYTQHNCNSHGITVLSSSVAHISRSRDFPY